MTLEELEQGKAASLAEIAAAADAATVEKLRVKYVVLPILASPRLRLLKRVSFQGFRTSAPKWNSAEVTYSRKRKRPWTEMLLQQ